MSWGALGCLGVSWGALGGLGCLGMSCGVLGALGALWSLVGGLAGGLGGLGVPWGGLEAPSQPINGNTLSHRGPAWGLGPVTATAHKEPKKPKSFAGEGISFGMRLVACHIPPEVPTMVRPWFDLGSTLVRLSFGSPDFS